MLCLFVKLRRHSSCAVWPSDTTTVWPRSLLALLMVSHPLTQQLYGHALCLLCWWCLTLWHNNCMATLFACSVDGVSPSDTTTVWPRSLLALLMVSHPLTQQLYDHALCLLCWWCLTLWHNNCMTTFFACSVDGVSSSMVGTTLFPPESRASPQYAQLHGLPEPPFFKKKKKKKKKIARLTCRMGFVSLHKA